MYTLTAIVGNNKVSLWLAPSIRECEIISSLIGSTYYTIELTE